jgi:L-iditol 2-dehydrogenase
MARTVAAAVMVAPRAPIELREFPRPDLPAGGALLRTRYSEVCGTDVHLWHGRLEGVPYPIIPGHVSTGTLDEVQRPLRALDGQPLREGDRVAFFDVHRTCGRCHACTVARTPTRCPSRRVYGITDPASEGLLGGWAEAICLEPGVSIARLPDGVSDEAYMGAGCGLLTAVHVIERAGVRPGDRVLVQGVGAVGLSVVALAKIAGASWVGAIGDPDDRRALARAMGADVVVPLAASSASERREIVAAATGRRGPDIVVEAAGSPRAVEEGLELVRDGGVFVIAGHYTDVGSSTVNAHRHINRKHLDVRGCWGSEVRHFLLALDLLQAHATRVPWASIGTRRFRLDQLDDALARAEVLEFPKALVTPNG